MATQAVAELIYKLTDQYSAPALAMAAAQEKATASLSRIDKFKTASKVLDQAGLAYKKAQNEAKRMASALATVENPTAKMQRAMKRAEAETNRLGQAFKKQGASVREMRSALNSSDTPINKLAASERRLRTEVEKTNQAMARQKVLAQQQAAASLRRSERRQEWRNVGSMAGLAAAHKATRFGHNAFDTYLEFDKERRYGGAVMGLTYEQQKPLVKQALHGGATTRFNDIQWLEGQRDLANRGLKQDQILGVMPAGANLGAALDLTLPESVKLMENAIFGFKKDISTTDAAVKAANRTADLQVKASKISGMTPDDIAALYRFGANSAQMNNMSEESLLGFGGILKKAGIGGDQGGVAYRAMMAAMVSPTNKARTAMMANGLDFKNYQKTPDKMEVDPFVSDIARKYGVVLDAKTRGGLGKIFSNKELIGDPSKFTPAVMSYLGDHLEGRDAKNLKQIAGHANAYRDASMKGIDTNAFQMDLMTKMAGNPAFANAIFGSKQGGRIATALGNPEIFAKMMNELMHHSEGYSKDIADQRNQGAYGQYTILQGAIKNLMTNIGMSFDGDGEGGGLSALLKTSNKVVTSLAEMDHRLLRVATVAGAVGTAFVGFKSVANIGKLLGGGALTTSALALDGSAAALTEAAVALGAGGRAGAAANAAGAAGGAGKIGRAGGAMRLVGKALPWIYIGYLAYEYSPKNDKDYRDVLDTKEKQMAAAKAAGIEAPDDTRDVNVNRLNGGTDWGYVTGKDIPEEIREQQEKVDRLKQTVDGGAADIFQEKLVEEQTKLEKMQSERQRYVLSKLGSDYGPQQPFGPEMPPAQQQENAGTPAPGIPLPPPRPNNDEASNGIPLPPSRPEGLGAYCEAVRDEMNTLKDDVAKTMAEINGMLAINASPTINARVSVSGDSGGLQSSPSASANRALGRSRTTSLRDGKPY